MRKQLTILLLAALLGVRGVSAQDITRLGGDLTSNLPGRHAIQVTAPNVLNEERRLKQLSGFSTFHRIVSRAEGLGPAFSNPSCSGCHVQNGRGPVSFPDPNKQGAFPGSTMVVRVSLPGKDADGSPRDVPRVGEQLLEHTLKGKQRYRIRVRWREITRRYPDGTIYRLRKPEVRFRIPRVNPRRVRHTLLMTPPVIGPGLIELIPEEAILALSDPEDQNGDGISGRPNWVTNRRTGARAIGRFGYKASNPTLEQQSAAALFTDMGVTNPLFQILGQPIELSDADLELLVIYQALAGIPAARNQEDPAVIRGKSLFQEIGCDDCHQMNFSTGPSNDERAFQTFHPFTDLLLHDMGPGLASNRGEFGATGSEWRTTPLWGLGFSETLSNVKARFLHDGRARTVEEAILWHGGEAERSKDAFKVLPKDDREALLAFLRSL